MAQLATKRSRIAEVPQRLVVEDLSMGLELRVAPSLLKAGQSRLCRNWSLEQPGALVTYPGWETFSATSLGARRIQGGHRIYLDGVTPFTLAADNGKVYSPTDGGVWGSQDLSGLSTANQVYFPHDRTLVAVFDGATVPRKTTDGVTWSQMGIAPPLAAPTLSALNASGTLVDTHVYEVSYAYQDNALVAVGNESATTQQAVAAPNLTIRAAIVASTDPQVDSVNIYVRDVTAGETVRRKYSNVANTTTNRDILANTWTSGDPAPSDHTVPLATLIAAVVWKNRWWAWVGNRLYFTQIFEPQSWPSLFYIDIPFERGDDIAAVAAQGDTLVVWGQSSQAFLIIGQTSLDFEVRPALGAQAGAFGPRAVCVIENGIVHVTAEGVYIFDGSSDRLLSYNIDPAWRDLVTNTATATLEKTAVIYHGLRKELRIIAPRLYPFATAGEWVLDLNRTRTQEAPAWTSTDRNNGGYIVWDGAEPVSGDRGRLFAWSDAIASLTEEAIGTDADGDDLLCDYEGATHTLGGYMARFVEGYVEVKPAAGAFTLTPYVDSASKGAQALDIATGLAPYGAPIPYGTASRLYGGAGRAFVPFMLPLTAEGRTLAYRARYAGRAAFTWFTYGTELQPETAVRAM